MRICLMLLIIRKIKIKNTMSRIMSLPELLKLKGISLLEKLNSYKCVCT